MEIFKRTIFTTLKLLLFWVLVFDFQRILFSIHNFEKLEGVSFWEWLQAFFFSIRVDLSMAAFLCFIPFLILIFQYIFPGKWSKYTLFTILFIELIIVTFVQSGEINAYTEWNHKLTTRVFMHLANPDEVFKSADYSMTIGFIIFSILELIFGWKLLRYFTKNQLYTPSLNFIKRIPIALIALVFLGGSLFLTARGGWQPIPINTDAAYYSYKSIANDLSVNSVYYFVNSFRLYNRSNIDDFIPKMSSSESKKLVSELYNYPKKHDQYVFKTKKPNFIFIVLEGWSADVVDCFGKVKGITPQFDKLAKEGILFTHFNACGGTSEIGNSSIFSGYPALPEISISMQPEKHRKLHTLNEDLEAMGYHSSYIFSGDLKYGNIGSYFIDHGFDDVQDEKQFNQSLSRGKLNFYDEDLYKKVIENINHTKEPFMQCAFTGSTHSPYDHPIHKNQKYVGAEQEYVNSIIYGDECLGKFIKNCKKQKWFNNTVFVFVADHGHPSPANPNPNLSQYFRIPCLIYGNALKEKYRGVEIDKIGSQSDIVATILYQLNGDLTRYPWSKDLLNPQVHQFALHTVNRGFGWISEKGNMSYHMDTKMFLDDSYKANEKSKEVKNCHAFLNEFYKSYKNLDRKK
ncbi:MAG: sulfatase-like hydrolase/transferase [Flavobacteriia bacterium]|nr:sulfatase-like hydrolase/transferase [Flavobacteriia bacterium]